MYIYLYFKINISIYMSAYMDNVINIWISLGSVKVKFLLQEVVIVVVLDYLFLPKLTFYLNKC